MFLWIERKIEGDRVARIRLDAAPLSLEKLTVKSAKHAVWIAVALWTGFTFVGYFTPIKTLAVEAASFGLGSWESFWVLFYGFATYGNAGWMREQVCKYMCPYARFQGVMFDRDTLTITYDAKRGEPRGPRSKKSDHIAAGLGHCVDCQICVQVCPVGIDIRKGLQYECIGCAACVDGCDQVMDRWGYPRGLIRYTTENALARDLDAQAMWRRVFRPRTLIYAAVLLAIVSAAAGSLAMRNPLKVDVIRDRGALAREAAPGVIENVYRLQLMNTDEEPRRFTIRAEGLPGLKVIGIEQPVAMGAAETRLVALRLRAALESPELEPGTHKIEFIIQAVGDEKVARHEKSSFIIPR
jgi:cytochrome c oxidase accessory protein FixG